MIRSGLLATNLLLFASLFITRADCADKLLRGESEQLKVMLMKVEDPEVVACRISFALRITNLGKEAVSVGSSPVFVTGIQRRDEQGVWSFLNTSSWFDDGGVRYEVCSELAPGKSATTPVVVTQLFMIRRQLLQFRETERTTIRFQVEVLCRKKDGNAIDTDVLRTEPVAVTLPKETSE